MNIKASLIQRGFTLAELLIALAILGEIATFTIPKIISAQQTGQKKTVIKETFAAMSEATYMGVITGNITDATSAWSYYQTKLNTVKFCTNAQTEGCWSGSSDVPTNGPTERGILLHTGAMITDYGVGSWTNEVVFIDWNGTAGPNLKCNDQIPIVMFFQTGTRDSQPGKAGQTSYVIPPSTATWSCPASLMDTLL